MYIYIYIYIYIHKRYANDVVENTMDSCRNTFSSCLACRVYSDERNLTYESSCGPCSRSDGTRTSRETNQVTEGRP